MEHPVDPHNLSGHFGPSTEAGLPDIDVPDLPGHGWGEFQDEFEDVLAAMADGDTVDLTSVAPAQWRIRIRAGWPGVDGPGTLAYHLQIGTDTNGDVGAWADTPYAQSFGFTATRIAGAVAALGLDHHPVGISNPSLIAAGTVGALEIGDMAVEVLRDAFHIASPTGVRVEGVEWVLPTDDAPETVIRDRGPAWWQAQGFTEKPWQDPTGDHLVGWVDGVLIEVAHDHTCLPGLSVAMIRGRVTDPAEVPVAAPGRPGASFLQRVQSDSGSEVSLESVTARGHLVHVWAHRMVVASVDDTHDDNFMANTEGVRDAVTEVGRFVTGLRLVDPEAMRPSRMAFGPVA